MRKSITRTLLKLCFVNACFLLLTNNLHAQAFTEGFDNISSLSGWDTMNLSSPIGIESWVQGYSHLANQVPYFTSHSGHDSSYICTTFNNGSGTATLSNWLMTPAANIHNGDTLSFYTRSTPIDTTVYPDRLQVRMSSTNSSNAGSSATSVGDFTTLMLDINASYTTTDYPLVWTQYSLPVSGLSSPVNGRFAFRYFVENGGPTGANSFLIGIDDVRYAPIPVGINSIATPVSSLHIFPNPATSTVTFDMGTPVRTDAAVTITNDLGQVVSSGTMNKGTKSHVLDITRFAVGSYTVKVIDGDKNIYISTFLKN